MRDSPKPIRQILHRKSAGLREVMRRAHELETLGQALKRCLPDSLAGHVELANLRGQVVVLSADSPAWATRLRYQRHAITRQLSSACGVDIRDMRIKVNPNKAMFRRLPPPKPPGPSARRHLLEAAGAMQDPELAGALRRLARSSAACKD